VQWDQDKDSRLIVVKATNGPFGGVPMHPESGVPPSTSTSIPRLAALLEESDDLWFSVSLVEFGEDHYHELEPFTRINSRPLEPFTRINSRPLEDKSARGGPQAAHARAEWQAEEATAAQRQLFNLWGTQLTFFIRHEHQYDDPHSGETPTLTRRASLQVPRHLQRAKTTYMQRRAIHQEESEVSDAASWNWIPSQLRRHVNKDADSDAEGPPAAQPPPPPSAGLRTATPHSQSLPCSTDEQFGELLGSQPPSSRSDSRPASRPTSKPASRPASSCERRPSCERPFRGRSGALS